MDNPITSNPTPESAQPTDQSPAVLNKVLVIVFLVLLVIAVAIAVLFYFRIQKLSKELTRLQVQVLPTPTASQAPNGDLANWKTYTDILGYSFSYPQEFELETIGNKNILRIDPPDIRNIASVCPRYISFSPVVNGSKENSLKNKYSCINKSLIKDNKILIETQYPESQNETIDQILSTFKFLGKTSMKGKFCGGIAANLPENQCPGGFYCKLDGSYPDAGGHCVKK